MLDPEDPRLWPDHRHVLFYPIPTERKVMTKFNFPNVNVAFKNLVDIFAAYEEGPPANTWLGENLSRSPSRVGDVIRFNEPVTITFTNPTQRVLLNDARDANPFFHLYEALWMLQGCNEIAPLEYYAANYAKQVQDGSNPYANGAYGYRWRHAYGGYDGQGLGDERDVDQLDYLIRHLKAEPRSRRAVLQMWNVQDDLLRIDNQDGAYSKDVCCNTCAFFELVPSNGRDVLNMTVINRSNDLIWGTLGANYVHFSFLQEYMAGHLNATVGKYHQITNNLHAYTERFKADDWLHWYKENPRYDQYEPGFRMMPPNPEQFDSELPDFIAHHMNGDDTTLYRWRTPWLSAVANPMLMAFHAHKKRDYTAAIYNAMRVEDPNWKGAAIAWLNRRRTAWEAKNELS